MGTILRIDLTSGKISQPQLDPVNAREYIGGRGLATHFLLNEINPQIDALSEENKLIFATGPLTGTYVPAASRYMVVTKSPLTGTMACSNSGGYF